MTVTQKQELVGAVDMSGYWSGDVDISRTPSPGIPAAKRMKMSLDEIAQQFREEHPLNDDEYHNLLRVQRTPESLGYDNVDSFRELWVSSNDSTGGRDGRKKMRTGCIPCLYV